MSKVEQDPGATIDLIEVDNSVTAINVKAPPYSAKGDGKTDDSGAIQKALDAVGAGGIVFFPPGTYGIKKPLYPRSKTQMLGAHVPVYTNTPHAVSACKISVLDDFTPGTDYPVKMAAIMGAKPHRPNERPNPQSIGVQIKNLALDDLRTKTPRDVVHGVLLPDKADRAGEASWNLEHVTIQGFNGSGLYGRWHVATFLDVRVVRNGGWGVNAGDADNNWNDVRFVACQFCYNAQGNVWLGGAAHFPSAAIEFIGCRSERAGIHDAFLQEAPGWLITRAARVNLVGCSTDANAGNGVEIRPSDLANARDLSLIQIVGSAFGRDGAGGDKTRECAGVKIDTATQVRIVGCSINVGSPDDFNPNKPRGPKYGLWLNNAQFTDVVANNVEGVERGFNVGGPPTLYRSNVQDMRNRLFTVPDVGAGELPEAANLRRGMMIWDASLGKPFWWSGTQWLDAMKNPRLPAHSDAGT